MLAARLKNTVQLLRKYVQHEHIPTVVSYGTGTAV
eukprot:SAG25_NODE_14543_length_253_cov_1.688312_1_plen_34_part_10